MGQRLQDLHLSVRHLPIYRIRWRGGAESLQEEEAQTFTKYTDVGFGHATVLLWKNILLLQMFEEKLTCLS